MKPMLAKEPADISALPYPVLVQPKLDGIRAVVKGGKLLSRNLKPIPNAEIRAALERPEFEGFDGEILLGDGTNFQATTSYVMAENKTGGGWSYNVFDLWDHVGSNVERQEHLRRRIEWHGWTDAPVFVVTTTVVENEAELAEFEAACLKIGFEGVIARKPDALYKFGRSTPKSGPLWKIKRFIDFEAEVIGVYEELANNNPATTNALGRTERSSHAANKVGKGTLGGLILRALNGPAEGCEFRCGTGFDAASRAALWQYHLRNDVDEQGNPLSDEETHDPPLTGFVAKVKSFPIGVKEAPRFPVFLGWRDMEIDG